MNKPVIVVTGLPRSGTSMMMRMLEAGGVPVVVDGVRENDAGNPNGYYEFEPVKKLRLDSSWVESKRGKAVKIIYRLLYDLPPAVEYDVVYMQRDLEEVVESQDEMLQRSGAKPNPPKPDSEEARRMIGLFRNELRRVEEWLAAQPNFRVLPVDYNRTIEAAGATSERVRDFLGRDLDTGRMEATVSPALYRHRRSPLI